MNKTERALLSTSQAIKYVGSREFWQDLTSSFPGILSPIRVSKSTGINRDGTPRKGKTEYLRADVDTALKAAKLSQKFVAKD